MDDTTNSWQGAAAAQQMLPCYICGRGPTAVLSVSRGLGMILARREWTYEAPLCRDHGTAIARNWLVATALMGWWGIVSFFVNWLSIAKDVRAWLAARRLAPAGSVIVPSGFGWTAPVENPHVPRFQLVGFAGLIVALVAFGAWSATYGARSVGDLQVGSCFNDDPTAVDVLEEVTSRPCNEAHDSEVFAILAFSTPKGGAYPSATQLEDMSFDLCARVGMTYLGNDLDVAATVGLGYLTPTREGWERDDRRLLCYFHVDSPTLTHSLRAPGPS